MILNEYIIKNAGRGVGGDFIRRFSDSEVFFSVDVYEVEGFEGYINLPKGVELGLQVANINMGQMGVFYSSRDDVRLGKRFAGMPLIRAAQMVCDLPDVDGILIQSDSDAWFAARKEALREVIGQVRDDVFYKDFSMPPGDS